MAYSIHLKIGTSTGWNTKVFCSNKTISSNMIVQDVTSNYSEVTCKRCLSKIAKFMQTEQGRSYLTKEVA